MDEDPLGPARGCVYGILIGIVLWAIVVIGIVWWYH